MQRKTKTHFHNKYQNSNEANMFDEMPKRKAKTIPKYLFLGRTGEEHLIPAAYTLSYNSIQQHCFH